MNQDEIQVKIEAIKKELVDGDHESFATKERVQKMIDEIFYPAHALRDVRFTDIGRSMYAVTHAVTLDKSSRRARSVPLLRASREALTKFLLVLEKMDNLANWILPDPMWGRWEEPVKEGIKVLLKDLDSLEDFHQRELLIKVLAGVMFQGTMDLLETSDVPMSINTNVIAFIRQHTKSNGSVDYRSLGQYFFDARSKSPSPHPDAGTLAYMSICTAMLEWSTDPKEARVSQKANGIQKMVNTSTQSSQWEVAPSVFLSLEDCETLGFGELLQTIQIAFRESHITMDVHSHRAWVNELFKKGVFVRTCPATPRPGALENVLAHTPVELMEGVRYLHAGMTDKDSPDYDPQGCLCIMEFIPPSCSGVMVKGHNYITMGPSYDGVTAGGGSNVVFTLAPSLADLMTSTVGMMNLDDGMVHHELEFVWSRKGSETPSHQLQRLMTYSRVNISSQPVITQVRGLHEPKSPPKSPPTLECGTLVTIRGNVPEGHVEQKTHVDVGQGDLSDCIELEQMAEKGELPEGLVVYCPSGSTEAHVGGVGIQWGIPVVYTTPRENGIIWTEIDGWVTDKEDIVAQPYDPAAFTEYYIMGCEDGDKFWNYGSVALSQFFHTYISGPINDARFEAYLAGIYSTWILKATLAVAFGEGRHAYMGQKTQYFPVHGLIHAVASKALSDDDDYSLSNRESYYNILKQTEIGVDNIGKLLKAYRRLFAECKWPGSYGGKNYKESVEKGIDAADEMLKFMSGEGSLQALLGKVNTLENAVHNCAFFFNKFIADKAWFDIGTAQHKTTGKLEWQYRVVSSFHHRFYSLMEEEHMISRDILDDEQWLKTLHKLFWEHDKIDPKAQEILPDLLDDLIAHPAKEGINEIVEKYPDVEQWVTDFQMCFTTYCEDCESHECGCFGNTATPFHHEGECGLPFCANAKCQETAIVGKYGLNPEKLQVLPQIFNNTTGGNPYAATGQTGSTLYDQQTVWIMSSDEFGPVPVSLMTLEGVSEAGWDTIFNPWRIVKEGEVDKESNVFTQPNQNVPTETSKLYEYTEISEKDWKAVWKKVGDPKGAEIYPRPVLMVQYKSLGDKPNHATTVHMCSLATEKVLHKRIHEKIWKLTERQKIKLLALTQHKTTSVNEMMDLFNADYPSKSIDWSEILEMVSRMQNVFHMLRLKLTDIDSINEVWRISPAGSTNWQVFKPMTDWRKSRAVGIFRQILLAELSNQTEGELSGNSCYSPPMVLFNKLLTRYSITFVKEVLQ